MQSYFQYRRLKRHLEGDLKKHGLEAAMGVQNGCVLQEVGQRACSAMQVQNSEFIASTELPAVEQVHQVPTVGEDDIGIDCVNCIPSQSCTGGDNRRFIVDFQSRDDKMNPQNWSRPRKWIYTAIVGTTGFVVSGASAIDTEVASQAARSFGVSKEVELMSTALYMVALGLGSLVSAPFSETVGRNPVYIICKLRLDHGTELPMSH